MITLLRILVKMEVGNILIRVKLKGMLASSAGFRDKDMEVESGIDIHGLLEFLEITIKPSWLIASVNNSISRKTTVIEEGDTVEIFIAGGGG
ncbi:Sulfur carrier protein ThiS (thiamine biosynthesis) [Dethiosulfatibacter aminovorans DSM 17477]|uniref:Sulfur carrier protein ThiS (Thiamine biosynthesis) n=1 Tax=Dethiosulfatibacter aminovorans DSM 17477 TaxID=1121476 RepID=A0A1M6BTT5_9FIRM|nr:MoaD/ThiS family protein [Dethiosulfatibacter aminovorans]SHI52107.1 Sulfur carrier protein ThiS (thiamine biosynthesis) [Dethiosulfatibacter aminovorans DSM 17477]